MSPVQLSDGSLENADEKPKVVYGEFPEGGVRAWLVVLGAYCVSFSTFGYMNAYGVYQEYYSSHFLSHESPSSISWIGSIQVFFLYAGGLVGGPLFDRYGAKVRGPEFPFGDTRPHTDDFGADMVFPLGGESQVIYVPALATVVSVMMTSLCTKYYQFMLAQGLLGGLASGMLFTPIMTCVGHYFRKRRGVALGLTVTGSSTGGVIFPIALTRMLKHRSLGFGWSVRIIGFIILVMMIVAVFTIKTRLPPRRGAILLPSAFTQRAYVLTTAGIFFMTWGLFTPFFYLPQYALQQGMSLDLADYMPSVMNAASVFGRVLPGIAADQVGPFNTMLVKGTCAGILLLCWPAIKSNAAIIVFAVLYGFFSGGIVSLMSPCFARITPHMNQFGTYLGMAMAVLGVAGLTGTPICGAMIQSYGGYSECAIFSGVVMLFGSLLVAWARLDIQTGLWQRV
ncbi:hypothetical protein PV08_00116 [Exophiala spinifera]|uniref:Major facilitator superfamily (MFS) profile domain-containing protein n=1 Tax=Exophiala spinifera TaxID=91928 RepID=A0A0D2C7M9_9EURO|nr:uncharacterized protein PV08_00116 [Exophiala spinifera]KIW19544.1 hypothetical protein PV08_00116 [Exophiala spinifera]